MLRKLIELLKKDLSEGKHIISDTEKIILNLEEMDGMIEMDNVKQSFSTQILLILLMRKNGYSYPFKKMHTVLSGPPGIGKTTLSILIARIWSSLNLLKYNKKDDLTTTPITSSELKVEYKKDIAKITTEIRDKMLDILILLDSTYDKVENPINDIPDFVKTIYSKSQDTSELCDDILYRYSKYFSDIKEDELDLIISSSSEDDNPTDVPYIILGREDFVGAYQGETSLKTKKILEENKGKIIIIEEAYSLFTSKRDSYGMEALTIINRYMDEYPNDYIFIFNGYIDKLENTIFKAQPGLRRRIQWQFNIDSYSANGIFRIFKHQLSLFKNPTWKIFKPDEKKFENFFSINKKYFPHFGGDTERLILQLQLEYSKIFFYLTNLENSFEITYEILEKSFEEYKKISYCQRLIERPLPFGMYI